MYRVAGLRGSPTSHPRGRPRVGWLMALLALALAACQGGSADTTTATNGEGGTSPTTAAPAATTQVPETSQPTTGGELIVDINAPIQPSIDPLRWNGQTIQRAYRLAVESLYTWNEDQEIIPQLAAELPEITDDGLTYTVSLRPGVTFHNGKQLTAEDVVFSFETIGAEESQSQWKSRVTLIESITTPDDLTVVFTLSERFTPFLGTLARIPIVPSNVPYTDGETYTQMNIGTGPFQFGEWIDGVSVSYDRFDDYWGERANVDRVTLRVVPEEATRTANLINGESHILVEPSRSQVPILEERGAQVNVAQNYTNRYYMYANLSEGKPTASYAFRRAVAEAIDRQRVIDQVLFGTAVPASTYLSSGADYFNEELGTFFGADPDVAEAEEFLAEAGGAPAAPLKMIVINTPALNDIATIIQANLSELGIEVQIQSDDLGAWINQLFAGDYDLALLNVDAQAASGFGSEYPYLGYHSGFPSNLNGVNDPELDALLEAAVTAPDGPEAADAWEEVQRYDIENGLYQIQIVTDRYVEAVNPMVSNYETSSLGVLTNADKAMISR